MAEDAEVAEAPGITRQSRSCETAAAGWSLGETCFGTTWQIDGTNGENTPRLFDRMTK
jgi:hypothetical protein